MLSIIIVNYKTKGLVKQQLKAINKFSLPFHYETIVVDNNSGDGIKEAVMAVSPTSRIIILPTNQGYAAGVNRGIKIAQGDYLLILNPDIVITQEAILKMIQFLKENKRAGLVGPRLIKPNNQLQYSCFTFYKFFTPIWRRTILGHLLPIAQKELNRFLMKDFDHLSNRCVDWLQGSCLLVKRAALRQVGLMDERFFLYFEDTDWCRSFWQHRWQVWYLGEVSVVHYFKRSSAENSGLLALFSRLAWIHVASWLKYFKKWQQKSFNM